MLDDIDMYEHMLKLRRHFICFHSLMSKKKKTFKDIKIKKPINVVEEVLPPPIEPEPVVQQQPDPMALLMQANEPEPVVQQQLDPMMLLMQATAQLAQGINTMLE
jgi:hypothetical protein